MDKNTLWKSVLGELELTISKPNFTTWFKGTYIISYEGDRVVIGVPNTFTKAWLEKKFRKVIYDIFQKITQNNVRVIEYKVETRRQGENKPVQHHGTEQQHQTYPAQNMADMGSPAMPHSQPISPLTERRTNAPTAHASDIPKELDAFQLNSKYIFDSYIVGKCNELANAAAKAVAQNPGTTYNPLFIYGDVGLGKTHLLQAVGNHIRMERPNTRILYVSCEKFTNDFIRAIATKNLNNFKKMYRTVDVLLMDDVQFLAGKESTQEEFFHTFNELHQNNRQLVVTSDRPPKAIPALESRLLSRFEWGMIADISTLDLETRLAIVTSKCHSKGMSLTPECIDYISRTIHNNVRELEGALNRIHAYTQLHSTDLSLEDIKSVLSTIGTVQKRDAVSVPVILRTISEYFNITEEELLGKSREKRLVYPRQLSMYLLREEMRSSYPSIGKELGGRDHTTAMHACQKIEKLSKENEAITNDINLIKKKLYA